MGTMPTKAPAVFMVNDEPANPDQLEATGLDQGCPENPTCPECVERNELFKRFNGSSTFDIFKDNRKANASYCAVCKHCGGSGKLVDCLTRRLNGEYEEAILHPCPF